jgi:aryl-alcohol dehydrogenase-like predicted oxidoreductase
MEERRAGASDVTLSVVGFGGYWLGGEDPARAAKVLEAEFAAGVNWVDTAEGYFDGANERNLGIALRSVPAMQVGSKITPSRTPATADAVRRACEASLRRLDRDVLDVYLVHFPDSAVALEETWSAMAELVESGLTRSIGLSNFSTEDVRRAHSIRPVDVVQDGLSLIDNLTTLEHFAACAELRIAAVVYEPLANGLLTGSYGPDSDLSAWREWPNIYDRLFAPGRYERSCAVADGLRVIAEQCGCTVSQLAIAWCFHQRGVSSVLVGTTSIVHAISNAAAAEVALTDAHLAQIESLIPLGPSF